MREVGLHYKTRSGTVQALRDLSMSVPRNAFVSVIGPSGCGKTTLLKVISRVLAVSSGSIYLDGKPLDQVDLAGRLSFVFQRPLLLPWRSALKNVVLPLEFLHKRVRTADVEKARAALALVGLSEFQDKAPYELSVGMQQRVSLARALVVEPELLLMDEPFSAADEITRETLQSELLQLWQKTHSTILFVTHSIQEAVLLSDQVVVLSQRPGSVIRLMDVDFPRPRDLSIRQDPSYYQMVEELRGLLRDPETRLLR
jgi:NitT/TauT family transport system ATP-binding protein